MKWIDLMIDVECAGIGDRGALMSIGACFFSLEDCSIGPTFYRAINLATSVRDGGEIDPATMIFWLSQSQAARDAVRFSTADVRVVMQEFSDFIGEHSRHQDVRPYGNSAKFDLAKIEFACKAAGVKTPWFWTQERCFRTIRNLYPNVPYDPSQKGDDAHHALADAKFQAEHLFSIKNRNKRA